ncbi:MAG: hypothetical protein U0931_17430 [Vulcanimicrobiota bacterium]
MRRSQVIAWFFLVSLLTLGGLSVIFYDRLPWVGTHFVHKNLAQTTRWSVMLQLQEGSALGNKVSLEEVPAPSRDAQLKGVFLQQGQPAGQEWAEQLRMESLESVTYSWQQKDNKELLTTFVETRIGPGGGLRNMEIKPPSRSLWLRQEIIASWMQTLWPQFAGRGIEPKASWNSTVPFKVHSRELANPVDARWDCTWTYRGNTGQSAVPLAMLDVQATAGAPGQAMDGTLRAEVAYDLKNQWVAATRGSFQIRYAIPTQATEQSTVVLQECFQVQFQAVRLLITGPGSP